MSEPQLLSVDVVDGVATVTLRRADKLNALNTEVIAALTQAFLALEQRGDVRAAVFTGEGKAFIAGADIAEMVDMTTPEAARFTHAGHRLAALFEAVSFPVIAAANGYALGGGLEMALGCDFIIASEKAKFGQPEVTLGVIPGFGGTQRLARRIGIAKARQLLYTGDIIGAGAALAMGLVNEVVPATELMDRAHEIATTIASRAPLAVAAAKRVALRGEGQSLEAACELEAQAFASLFGSEDLHSGMRAFLDKTTPTFHGR